MNEPTKAARDVARDQAWTQREAVRQHIREMTMVALGHPANTHVSVTFYTPGDRDFSVTVYQSGAAVAKVWLPRGAAQPPFTWMPELVDRVHAARARRVLAALGQP